MRILSIMPSDTSFKANLQDMKGAAKKLSCPSNAFYYLGLARKFKKVEKVMAKNNIKNFVFDLIKENDVPKVLQDIKILRNKTFMYYVDSFMFKNDLNLILQQNGAKNPNQLVFNAKTFLNLGKKLH